MTKYIEPEDAETHLSMRGSTRTRRIGTGRQILYEGERAVSINIS